MSSNDSTSSSRLSQFGLYRTIDARTEEFLKLSRRRQIRQGCACAAVSTAVTVTVVVSILILYGYGVSSAGATPRPSSWLDLMNDSTDTTPFDDKFQNSIKFDRAGVNLLPVFFDKLLEDQESSTLKYEFPTETNSKRNVFPGFLGQAKIPTPGLYSIQYKTYPILYLQSPRNTEYYMKVRKTREYERIMSYIDKMINEKVGFGTRSIVNQQYPTTTTKHTETSWTDRPRTHKTTRVITKPKESKVPKNILQLNNDSKRITKSKAKFNNTSMYENKNCKCRNNFGTLINKLIKCFQALVKDSSEQPCKNNTPKKTAIEVKNQGTEIPAPSTTSVVTTTRVRPAATTTHSTTTTSTTKPSSTTTNDPTDDFNSTEFPAEIFNFSNIFLKKPALLNDTKIKPKGLLSQMSPFYVITGNTDSKIDIPKSNTFARVKPKSNIFSTKKHKSKLKNTNEQNFISSITKKDFEETTTSTSTVSPEKSEEIFQNLLFPETKDLEYARLPQKAVRKYSSDYILRPRSRARLPPVIKPNTSTKPPTTSTSYNLIQHQTDNHYKVSTENIIVKTTSSPYAPILSTNSRPYSGITPEDYIMERIRQGHKKQNKTFKSFEPLGHQREKSSNNSMFYKIKSLLKAKLMQSRLKSPFNRLSARIMKSKTEPKYFEDKQTVSPSKVNITTKYNVENFTSPYVSTTIYNRVTTSTTQIPLALEGSPSPTQLRKYPADIDPFLPEITTESEIKESNSHHTFQKLERRNTYVSREDIYTDNDIYKPSSYDSPRADMKTTTEALKNNSVLSSTTDHVIDVKNSSMSSKEIHKAYVSLGLDKITSIHNTEKKTWESLQIDDNYTPYYKYTIPVGRKSYLEISRGDWKPKEPHMDDTNVMYDAFDDVDGL